jgi:Inositol monophosphatase family
MVSLEEKEALETLAQKTKDMTLGYFEKVKTLMGEEEKEEHVTQAELALEKMISNSLKERFPDDSVYGKTGLLQTGSGKQSWWISRISGRPKFKLGWQQWACSISRFNGVFPSVGILIAPASDEIFCGGVGEWVPNVNGDPDKTMLARSVWTDIDVRPSEVPTGEPSALIDKEDLDWNSPVFELMDLPRGVSKVFAGRGLSACDIMGALAFLIAVNGGKNLKWSVVDLTGKLDVLVKVPCFDGKHSGAQL